MEGGRLSAWLADDAMSSFLSDKRVGVTGGAGFLGRAVCECLRARQAGDIVIPRSSVYDFTKADAVAQWFEDESPDLVIHLAAEVGGIGANQKQPGRFFYANLAMGLHLIEESRRRGVAKFVQVGTVCAYPRDCRVPFQEDDLWSGFPEETNAPYGVAKRALGVMLEAYRAQYRFNGVYLIPVNLYGPHDNFDPDTSHVIPALIRKFAEAVEFRQRTVSAWGSGSATREFLYVDDAAEAIVMAAEIHNDPKPINLGTGREVSIAELAQMIGELCGFTGEILWDKTRPDGQPRRSLDTRWAATLLNWQAKTELEGGLRRTIDWWKQSRVVASSTA